MKKKEREREKIEGREIHASDFFFSREREGVCMCDRERKSLCLMICVSILI